jgi:hypothetical protein
MDSPQGKQLYFPSEGRHAEDFFARKNPTASAGSELAILGGGGGTPVIFFRGGSTNSVEDRGQGKRGSGGVSPLVRGSTQFANE